MECGRWRKGLRISFREDRRIMTCGDTVPDLMDTPPHKLPGAAEPKIDTRVSKVGRRCSRPILSCFEEGVGKS